MSKEIFEKFRGAMAYIEVVDSKGDIGIGSAFHVGEGVFVTARHVVSDKKIKSFATTESFYVVDENGLTSFNDKPEKYTHISHKQLSIKSGPYYPSKKTIDLAIIVANETDMPVVPLGGHLDDWINDPQFVLFKTIVMGYPPIPFSKHPILFTVSAEINAVIDKYNAPHPHFIISAMPRGGFSGGLCLIGECALGVIVESLLHDNKDTELGYMAVMSIEPIFVCLQEHNILPEIQKEGWEGFWDEKDRDYDECNNDKPF